MVIHNSKVATVSSAGVVKGIAAGTAIIEARTHNGYLAACAVTVKDSSALYFDLGVQFVQALKNSCKDPSSLKVYSIYIGEYYHSGLKRDEYVAFVDYSAKNSLGGVNRDTVGICMAKGKTAITVDYWGLPTYESDLKNGRNLDVTAVMKKVK